MGKRVSPIACAVTVGGSLLSLISYFWWRGTWTVSEARRRVKDGALLIDCDSPESFAEGHILGAVNVPVDDLGRRQCEVGPLTRPIVLYARGGLRSARGAHVLRSIGYHSVLNVGPMRRWTV